MRNAIIACVLGMLALIIALCLTFATPQSQTIAREREYYIISDCEPFDSQSDLVTVTNATGNSYAYYADIKTVIVGEVVIVTMSPDGEIVAVDSLT